MNNSLLLFVCHLFLQIKQCHLNSLLRPSPTIISDEEVSGSVCPINSLIQQEVNNNFRLLDDYYYYRPCQCGSPEWRRVAFLNFSDSSQACPKMSKRNYWPPDNITGCSGYNLSVILPVNRTKYSTVCGRILGIGFGLGFTFNLPSDSKMATIEDIYLSGFSLTHGKPGNRSHIWSFVATPTETYARTSLICPCMNTMNDWPHMTPKYVGQDYFCDGHGEMKYDHNVLWDGLTCGPRNTCCSFNSPPFFCKSLGYETSEDIEIRMFYHHIGLHSAEIYVK